MLSNSKDTHTIIKEETKDTHYPSILTYAQVIHTFQG